MGCNILMHLLEFSDVAVAYPIQPAVASVFSSFQHRAILAVMTNRLGRIIEAMLTFFLRLVWFLRETYVATVSRRIGARWVDQR